MRSVLHALIWDNMRHAGWLHLCMLGVSLFPMGMYAILATVTPAAMQIGDPVQHLLEVSMLPFVIFLLLMGAGAGFANTNQLYVKPLSNLTIAAWRTISGTVLLAVQIGVLVWLYNSLFNAGWPLIGAILFTIAVWFAAQPFFCLAGKSIAGTGLTMIPIALMCAWFITRYKPIGGKPRDWVEINFSETLQLLVVIAIFAWSSVHCVALARRGETVPLPAWWHNFWQRVFAWPVTLRERRPFRSASQALFWYDWRWKGWALPASLLFLLALIVPAELVRGATLEGFYNAVTAAYMGTFFPACLLGVLSGYQLESMEVWARTGSLGTSKHEIDTLRSFQATRPVSNTTLAHSLLRVCLISIGMTTTIWLLLVLPAFCIAASQGSIDQLFTQFKPFAVPLMGFSMWVFISNATSLGCTGRTKYLFGVMAALAAAFVGVSAVQQWLSSEALKQLMIVGLLIAPPTALFGLAVWSYARCWQLGYLSRRGLITAILAMIAVGSVGSLIAPTLDFKTISLILSVSVLSVLPWATTPLAIRWNRHR